MNPIRISILFAAVLGLAVLPRAQAWGPEGHEIVAEIALRYLTPAARAAVDDVLGTYKLGDYDVASWPDTIRGDKEYDASYPRNGRWHYIDFDAGMWYDDDFKLDQVQEVLNGKLVKRGIDIRCLDVAEKSEKVSGNKVKREVIAALFAYNAAFPSDPAWRRTERSLVLEWMEHNFAYRVGFLKSRASDVDLDNHAEGRGSFGYFLESAWGVIRGYLRPKRR